MRPRDPCARVRPRSARSCRRCGRSERALAWRARPRDRGRSALRSGLGCGGAGAGAAERRARLALALRFSLQKRHALAARPRRRADEARVGLDRGRVDAANLGGAAGERRELHRLEKGDEPLAVELRRRQRLERRLDRHVPIQSDELLRDPDALDDFGIGQRFAPLRLLDFAGAGEQRLEIAIFENELRRGLKPDAGRAGHVVGRNRRPAPGRRSPCRARLPRNI